MQAIWARGLRTEMNVTVVFTHTHTPQENETIALTASNLYRLWIDGKPVGYGPARAAHGYARVDEFSLSPWAGRAVVLAVEVFSANVNNFYTPDTLPFFAAEIRAAGRVLADAADFRAYRLTERVQRVRRFCFQRTFTESYRFTENPLLLYAGNTGARQALETYPVETPRLLPRAVPTPTYPVIRGQAIAAGRVTMEGEGQPWMDRSYTNIDPVRFRGFRPEELEEDAAVDVTRMRFREDGTAGGFYTLYDFGRTLTGFFRFHVSARTNAVLYIQFDEIVGGEEHARRVDPFRNACCNVLKYTFAPGEYDILSFEANSARFASVSVTAGDAAVADFSMVCYENPAIEAYVPHYADERLNKIARAAAHTLAQNAVDVLTDCPSRERAGWLCDSYFSGRAEAFFTGKNDVEKNFLENYALCPPSPYLPRNMLPMCYPGDHNDGAYIPNWSMWYILELRNYWKRTGDDAMLALSREKVEGLVRFFRRYENEDGLLENLESWVFIEWSRCNDADYVRGVNFPSNMLWSACLLAVNEMYGAPALADQGKRMRDAIRRLAWNGEFFEDNAVRDETGALRLLGHLTETCQYYAFFFHIAEPETYPALFATMREKFGPHRDECAVYPNVARSNAFIGNYLRLELWDRLGFSAQIQEDCLGFFLAMAERTGTLWEHSGEFGSLNHGFASMAAVYLAHCEP